MDNNKIDDNKISDGELLDLLYEELDKVQSYEEMTRNIIDILTTNK